MSDATEVCAAVINRGGRVLLATRRKGVHLEGCWEFPGGKVEEKESLSECIRRELREELGLNIQEVSFLFRRIYAYPGKKIALNFMFCILDKEQVAVGKEAQRVGWFTWSEAKLLNLASADRAYFNEVHEKTPME